MAEYVPPHTFKDGVEETASGQQVMDNLFAVFNQLINKFLKLAAEEDLKVKFGFANTGGFDSVAGRSRWEGKVAHGLGKTPRAILLTPSAIAIQENGGAPVEAVAASCPGYTATELTVVMTAPGTTNNGTTFCWLAIG